MIRVSHFLILDLPIYLSGVFEFWPMSKLSQTDGQLVTNRGNNPYVDQWDVERRMSARLETPYTNLDNLLKSSKISLVSLPTTSNRVR